MLLAFILARRTGLWVLTFELNHDPSENLLHGSVQSSILELIQLRAFVALGGGPVCTSMSRAVRPPVRDALHPAGIPDMRATMIERVQDGNNHSRFVAKAVSTALSVGTDFWVENAGSSSWVSLLCEHRSAVGFFLVDYC